MGELAERLGTMVVTATSPDGQVSARVRGSAAAVEVTFSPGAYPRYREDGLARRLEQLATLTFTRYRRTEQEIVAAVFAEPLTDDGTDFGPQRHRYIKALAHVVATGESDDGQLRVTARGLVAWEVTIAPGALRRRSEQEFLDALSTAVRRLLADYNAQVFAVQDEIYDLGYPEEVRQAAGMTPRRPST